MCVKKEADCAQSGYEVAENTVELNDPIHHAEYYSDYYFIIASIWNINPMMMGWHIKYLLHVYYANNMVIFMYGNSIYSPVKKYQILLFEGISSLISFALPTSLFFLFFVFSPATNIFYLIKVNKSI